MPMITIRYSMPRPQPSSVEAVAVAVNALSAEILGKDANLTAVTVEEIPADHWFIGNKSLAHHRLAAFWVDIRVVDGTNTRDEKAAFARAIFAKLGELLGPLHNESYVYVNDVRGDSYGYGGLTQNERYFAAKLKLSPRSAA